MRNAYTSTFRLRCPTTGAQVVLQPGPIPDVLSGKVTSAWTFTCSACGKQHELDIRPKLGPPAPQRRTIDIPFNIDLGELVEGHHVVARGIELRPHGSSSPCLHYDFVPALANTMNASCEKRHGDWWYWMMYTSDDVGTAYADRNTGGFDNRTEGDVSWGSRDLDGIIPESATMVTLRFEPPRGWVPPEPWRRVVHLDLKSSRVMED